MNHPARPLVRKVTTGLLIAVLGTALSGCGGMGENETAGSILGGVAGAVVGNQFGSGDGKTAATALGAVIGAMVGGNVGRSLDATSRQRAGAAAEHASRPPISASPSPGRTRTTPAGRPTAPPR